MTKRLLAISAIALSITTPFSWGQTSDLTQLEETRLIFEELVVARQGLANSQSRWRTETQTLHDNIELLQLEIELLEDRIDSTEEQSTQAERDRISLNGQIEELKEASYVIAKTIRKLEQRAVGLSNALPPEAKSKVEPLLNRIPKRNTPANEIRSSLGERMLNVVGLLQQLEIFNNAIHVIGETRDIDGQTISLNVIYIGLSQAYYVNKEQGVAGVGSVSIDTGWVWTQNNELVEVVDKAIKVFKSELNPQYVNLPISN